MKKNERQTDPAALRQKAEALLKLKISETASQLSEADALKFMHELEVHQIELVMQNEELQLAKNAAQEAVDKYIELYDFAPSGYVTLAAGGEILQLNLACAHMLGNDRTHLVKRLFRLFKIGRAHV